MRASSLWQHSVRGVVARVFPDHSRITGQGHAYSVLRNLSLQGMITSGRLDFVVSTRLSILGLFLGMLAFTSSASTVQSPTGPLPSMLPDIDERNEDSPGEAVIRLAESLINIESLSGSEHAMAHALKGWLSKRGWEVVLQPVPPALGHEEEVRKMNTLSWPILEVTDLRLLKTHPRVNAGTSTPSVPALASHVGIKARRFC